MKKSLAVLFAAILFLTMIPVSVSAAETDLSEYNELINLACEAFPEYASAIRENDRNSRSTLYSVSSNEVVFSDTRSISDSVKIGITQFSSGDIFVTKYVASGYEIDITNPETGDISNVGVHGSADFTVALSGFYKTFELSDVSFTIYYNASDYFTDTGTPTPSNALVEYNTKYVTTTTTLIYYPLTFMTNGSNAVDFSVYFSNNQLVAKVS